MSSEFPSSETGCKNIRHMHVSLSATGSVRIPIRRESPAAAEELNFTCSLNFTFLLSLSKKSLDAFS